MSKSDPDKEFILDPNHWPRWPFLPLKRYQRRGGFPEFGFLMNKSLTGKLPDGPVTLFKGSIYDMEHKKLGDFEREDFESVDKLLEAGWRVD